MRYIFLLLLFIAQFNASGYNADNPLKEHAQKTLTSINTDLDECNGSVLYYNRFRYYSPDEGMYLSQDPIRLLGGKNLYGYVHNTNAWVDIFGLAWWSDLKSTGSGHHPIQRSHAKTTGMTELSDINNSPSWYPNNSENTAKLHQAAHDAGKSQGIPYNTTFNGTDKELIEKTKAAYNSDSFEYKDTEGYLKIPSTGEILAEDITLAEAVDKQVEWMDEKRNECSSN